jgi:hypothetical protein
MGVEGSTKQPEFWICQKESAGPSDFHIAFTAKGEQSTKSGWSVSRILDSIPL